MSCIINLDCLYGSWLPELRYCALAWHLFVVAKENLDWQPIVTAHLEAIRQARKLLHLLISQLPTVNVKVGFDARLGDRLGNDIPAVLDTPLDHALLRRLALCLC